MRRFTGGNLHDDDHHDGNGGDIVAGMRKQR